MREKISGPNPEFAADADEGQLLGVDTRRASGLRKEFLDEVICADSHQLLQRGMKGIVVLVQEANLIGIGERKRKEGLGENSRNHKQTMAYDN